MVPLTHFWIFSPSGTFSQSRSHMRVNKTAKLICVDKVYHLTHREQWSLWTSVRLPRGQRWRPVSRSKSSSPLRPWLTWEGGWREWRETSANSLSRLRSYRSHTYTSRIIILPLWLLYNCTQPGNVFSWCFLSWRKEQKMYILVPKNTFTQSIYFRLRWFFWGVLLKHFISSVYWLQTTKLNISDMASLMPKGDSEEMAALLPRLMELQNRLDNIEGLFHPTTH